MKIGNTLDFDDLVVQGSSIPSELAILPVNDAVVFPLMMVPLILRDANLLRLADEALAEHKIIGAFTQENQDTDHPGPDDLYKIGTAIHIQKMIRFPNGEMRLLAQGISRVRLTDVTQVAPYLRGKVEVLDDKDDHSEEQRAYTQTVVRSFTKMIEETDALADELKIIINNVKEGGRLADVIATNLNIELERKQTLLAEENVTARLKLLSKYLLDEMEVMKLGRKLQADVKKEMDREQREYYLRQQLKAIRRELGEDEDRTMETEELRERIDTASLTEPAREVALKELDRLQKMSPGAAEYTVSKTYIDWILDIPWEESTEDRLDVRKAQKVLDEDHYDLEQVKERILEFLSVKKLKQSMKGSIICFVGPPGVGKTSLGKSIARAMGRKFVRISLGGMKDEAEVRGHRRTYIGALPGRIVQGLRTAGSNNPVFMLDEIDKLGNDFRGDPASALLEVLDPAQNDTFEDHYLNIPLDLSRVLFVTTANLLDPIPSPLLDRMELIEIPGYITIDKVEIAKKYLLPRQLDENGVPPKLLTISNEGYRHIVRYYTREAGVRELERKLAAICRKMARRIASGNKRAVKITERSTARYLGQEEYHREIARKKPTVGVVTGMAKTMSGGEILFIEALAMKGHGHLRLTGQLGGVMRESAEAAMSFIMANYLSKAEDKTFFETHDLHIHVPAGAVPKDGPSAGVAIAVAIASVLFNKPVSNDISMTGEITLTGQVLGIGGLKDKVIAAHRAGIRTILLPDANKRDVDEIPDVIKKDLKLVRISRASEAIDKMLIWD